MRAAHLLGIAALAAFGLWAFLFRSDRLTDADPAPQQEQRRAAPADGDQQPSAVIRLVEPLVQAGRSSDRGVAAGTNEDSLESSPRTAAPPTPLSIEDPDAFAASMEELYDGYSRRQMLESFQSLMSTMPDPPGLDVHQDKISSGDFVVVGSAEDIGGGRRAYKLGRATKDGKRPILDLVHGLSDGRVVTTSIEVVDVDPILADRVSEAVWLWGKISAR